MERRTTIKNAAKLITTHSYNECKEAFLLSCKAKNLSAPTLKQYKWGVTETFHD